MYWLVQHFPAILVLPFMYFNHRMQVGLDRLELLLESLEDDLDFWRGRLESTSRHGLFLLLNQARFQNLQTTHSLAVFVESLLCLSTMCVSCSHSMLPFIHNFDSPLGWTLFLHSLNSLRLGHCSYTKLIHHGISRGRRNLCGTWWRWHLTVGGGKLSSRPVT